jgi:hypothetical protein
MPDDCVIRDAMKKFLAGCLILASACQTATPLPMQESASTATVETPTQPATDTPAFTPTSAFTLTPVPLFFTDEFNTDLNAWLSFQTGGESPPETALVGDFLRLDISSPHTWYYFIHNAHTYKDVFISAKFVGTPSGSMGLVCRYSDGGWFEFNIASDGTYNVLFAEWLAEGIAQYTPIATDTSEYLHPGNLDYQIGLTCQENYLLLHINGKLFRKIDVTRFELTEGMAGISAASFEETPMIASFGSFSIGEPE